MNANGKPHRYAGPTHYYNNSKTEFSELMVGVHETRRENANSIPIEKFRSSVRAVKNAKQMSLAQMAEAGGWELNTFKYYMYSKRIKSVGREMGENFFRRLLGAPAPPTDKIKKRVARSLYVERRLEAARGIR